jgi:hypothetical protein
LLDDTLTYVANLAVWLGRPEGVPRRAKLEMRTSAPQNNSRPSNGLRR